VPEKTPVPVQSSDQASTSINIPIPGVKGKHIAVGGAGLGTIGGVLFYAASTIMSMHAEMVGKISSLEQKVNTIIESKAEFKQDIRDIRNDLNALARQGYSTLPSQRPDYTAWSDKDRERGGNPN